MSTAGWAVENEPLVECSRNGANYLRRSLVLSRHIGSPNPPGKEDSIIYDGGGIKDFAFDGSKNAKVEVDVTVVRTFGYQRITGFKDFIDKVRINHLIVTGKQDIEHVRDLYVGDPLVSLNSGIKDVSAPNNGYDLGLALQRGSSDKNVAFIWDENPPAEATAQEGGEFAFISTTEDGSTKGDVNVDDYLDIRLGNLNVEDDSKLKGSFYLTGENFDITVNNEVHDVAQNVLWDIEGNETHEVNGNHTLDVEGNLFQKVNGDISVTGDRITFTSNNETHNVEQDVLWDIEGDFTNKVNGNILVTGSNETHEVTNTFKLEAKDVDIDVTNDYHLDVDGNHTTEVAGDVLWDIEGNETHEVDGSLNLDVEGSLTQHVKGAVTITGDSISLTSNDETHTVLDDYILNVTDDHTVTVGGNSLFDIEGNETHLVEGNVTFDIEGGLTQNVAGAVLITGDSITLTSNNETHNVAVDLKYDVDRDVLWDIDGDETHNVKQDVIWNIDGDETHNVDGSLKFDVETNYTVEVAGDETHTVVGDITFGGDEINFNSRIFDVHTTEKISLISDKEVIIESHDPNLDLVLNSNKDLILTAVNKVLITGNNGVEITASGDSSITYSGASHLFQVDNADEYDLNNDLINAALHIRNSNTDATTPHSLVHFDLDKSDGDGYLGFIAGGSNHDQEFVLGEQGEEWLRVDEDGNLGLGTNNPGSKLHINDVNDVYIEFSENGAPRWKIGSQGSDDRFVIYRNQGEKHNMLEIDDSSENIYLNSHVTVTGDLQVDGNLQVDGTTTTINSTTLVVDDKNIELAHSPNGQEGNDAAIDGGGITLKSSASDKTILWNNANNSWQFNQHIEANDGLYVKTDKVRARDAAGLFLQDDDGNGIFIKDGGKVGIGTSSPRSTLELKTPARATAFDDANPDTWGDLTIWNPTDTLNAAAGIRMFVDSSDPDNSTKGGVGIVGVKQDANSEYMDLAFLVDSTTTPNEVMRLTHDNKVGIGTIDPGHKLTVEDDSITTPILGKFEATHASSTRAYLSFGDKNSTNKTKQRIGSFGDQLTLQTNASDRIIIDGDGDVGIGSNPERKLDVFFNENNSTATDYRLVDGIRILNNNSTVGSLTALNFATPGSSIGLAGRRNTTDNMDLVFFAEGDGHDGNPRSMMTLEGATNRLGVNVESPQAQLHVSGDAIIQKDDLNDSETLVVANYDLANADTQTTAIGFGLARDSDGQKPEAGIIRVGKERQWTDDDTHLDSYMSFSILDGMVSKEKVRIDSNGNVDVKSHNANNVGLKLGGTIVTASAAELNVMDGDTTATATTLVDADKVVVNDANAGMKQVALTDFETYFESALDDLDNVTSIGKNGATLTVQGHLTVEGTTTHINSETVDVEDKNIELGHVDNPSNATANGGGITLKGPSNSDKTIIWTSANNAWEFNQHVLPSADNTLNLGKAGQEWKDLYIDGKAYLDAINFNGTDLTVTAAELNSLDGLTANRALISDGNGKISASSVTNTEVGQLATIGATTISAAQWGYLGGMGAQPLESETSHADVVHDGDFTSQGFMKRGATAGSYSIVADNSANWNTAHGWGDHASAGYASDGAAPTAHVHPISDVTNLQTTLNGKAASTHTHAISDVTDLQTTLNGKAASGHTHASDWRGIDDTPVDGATTESISSNWAHDHNAGTGNGKHVPAAGNAGQFLKHDGTWGTPAGTGGGIELDALSVTTASATGGGALAYDNSNGVFTFTPPELSGGAAGALGDLSDVATTAPNDTQVLTWNATGGTWEPANATGGTGGGTITALNNQGENRLVTIGSTTTELDGEELLTFNGVKVAIGGGTFLAADRLTVNGNITAEGDITANGTTSDISLKENIDRISNPLQKIKRLNGFTFDWNEGYGSYDRFKGKRQVGVSAQDVEEVMPELVTKRENGQKAVKYEQMIPLLIEGMKEQQKQIADLEAKLNKKK